MNIKVDQNVIRETKETSKAYYSSKDNVTRKYISQFASISRADDYFCNKNCLSEVFNMLDIIAERRLEEYESRSERRPDYKGKKNNRVYVVYRYQGTDLYYLYPNSFRKRMTALRKYGCQIPESMDRVVRVVRNFTTHGNATVVLDFRPLNYEDVRRMMLIMADSLIALGALDPENREPDFEQMRVHPGSELQRGEYIIGDLIREDADCRIYFGTKKRILKALIIREFLPGRYEPDRMEENGKTDLHDLFFENGTYYIVQESVSAEQILREAAASAAETLRLSEKGQDSFCSRVRHLYHRLSGQAWPESVQQIAPEILRDSIRRVTEEYRKWLREHHITT